MSEVHFAIHVQHAAPNCTGTNKNFMKLI